MADDEELSLKFYERGRPEVHSVAAVALAQSLDAFQRLVHLTAMRREGRTPGRRVRPTSDIQARYRLVCDLPRPGSFVAPVRLNEHDLLTPSDSALILGEVGELLAAVGRQDENWILKALPDPVWRRFSLDAIERLAPPASTDTELEIQRAGVRIVDTGASRTFVERLTRDTTKSKMRECVIGQFKKIDFVTRQITIRHMRTGRDLSCSYEPLVEETLLDHPRDTLLVFGTVTRDASGQPESIGEVDHIEVVDEDPLSISAVQVGNDTIEPTEPILADVKFDEAESLYTATLLNLSVSTFAETREGLADAVESELALLWRRYATADDGRLTPAAQTLKKRMQKAFRRMPSAPQAS